MLRGASPPPAQWYAAAMAKRYPFGVHAVILDEQRRVLQLLHSYGERRWGLPGGGVEPGETVYVALRRECREELGLEVAVEALPGLYYHADFGGQVAICRCRLPPDAVIQLSCEHTGARYFAIDALSPVNRIRVADCLAFDGVVRARAF